MDLEKLESIAIELVANSGSAKGYIMEALSLAREGKYEESQNCLDLSEKALLEAHKAQTSLIHYEAKGDLDPNQIGILMIHAQDHLMTTLLAQDLVKEMILLHKKIDQQK